MKGKRKRGQPKKKWKRQVEKESKSVGLEKKDAMNRLRCQSGVNPATSVTYRWLIQALTQNFFFSLIY